MYTNHSYPEVLKDIILVEKAVIACAHSIISIIKLKPSSASISAFYSKICRHVMILP